MLRIPALRRFSALKNERTFAVLLSYFALVNTGLFAQYFAHFSRVFRAVSRLVFRRVSIIG